MFYENYKGNLIKIELERIHTISCTKDKDKHIIQFWPVEINNRSINKISFDSIEERDDCYQKILSYLKSHSLSL